jgi:hypothetical protein
MSIKYFCDCCERELDHIPQEMTDCVDMGYYKYATYHTHEDIVVKIYIELAPNITHICEDCLKNIVAYGVKLNEEEKEELLAKTKVTTKDTSNESTPEPINDDTNFPF